MGTLDWIVIAAVAVCFILAVVFSVKKGGCSGSCETCRKNGACQKKEK